jgi:transposase
MLCEWHASINFRRKVWEIKDRDGLSFEEAALRFEVSKSSVSRWAKRLEPCRTRNKPATKILDLLHKSCQADLTARLQQAAIRLNLMLNLFLLGGG